MRFPPQRAIGPYPSGSGHAAGSDTSAAREQREDSDGTTAEVRGRVLDVLKHRPDGMTWKEVDEVAKIGHHGRTSSALTHLRKAGDVFWLHRTRDGCHLFVHGMWRDRYLAEAVKVDVPRKATQRADAAEEVAIGVAAYLSDPTPERWDFIREAHKQWAALQ